MTIGKKLYVANVGDSRGILIKSLSEQQINDSKNSKEDLT
jgi:serine/threonine protein phosphatase PrpC